MIYRIMAVWLWNASTVLFNMNWHETHHDCCLSNLSALKCIYCYHRILYAKFVLLSANSGDSILKQRLEGRYICTPLHILPVLKYIYSRKYSKWLEGVQLWQAVRLYWPVWVLFDKNYPILNNPKNLSSSFKCR